MSNVMDITRQEAAPAAPRATLGGAMFRTWLCTALLVQAAATAPAPNVPARYLSGALPAIPVRAVGGGQVFLEVPVTRDGVITPINVLRSTPPFSDAMTTAVNAWRLAPAEREVEPVPSAPTVSPAPRERVDSTVLVAAIFRPPALNAPTLGEPPLDLAAPSSPDTPYPTSTTMPSYPPLAMSSGVVLVEVEVSASGDVADAKVIVSAPPFDQPALDAARQWKFRAGRARGVPVSKLAYIVFGFREPVTMP